MEAVGVRHQAVAVVAGTAISPRTRGVPNAYAVLDLAGPMVAGATLTVRITSIRTEPLGESPVQNGSSMARKASSPARPTGSEVGKHHVQFSALGYSERGDEREKRDGLGAIGCRRTALCPRGAMGPPQTRLVRVLVLILAWIGLTGMPPNTQAPHPESCSLLRL